jgi:hypothetical protein
LSSNSARVATSDIAGKAVRLLLRLSGSIIAVVAAFAAATAAGQAPPKVAGQVQRPPATLALVEDPAQQLHRIYQRAPSGGYTKSFTLNVVAGGDAEVEAQIVRATDGAEVKGWTRVGVTSGGTGTFAVAFPDGSHFVRFRKVGETGESAIQSVNRIGVGDNELMIGKSGMRNFSSTTGAPYPVVLPLQASSEILNLRRFSGHGYFDPTQRRRSNSRGVGTEEPPVGPTHSGTGGNGLLVYLQRAQAARGYPVGAYFLTSGGDLESWKPGGASFEALAAVLDAPKGPGWEFTRLHIFGAEDAAIRRVPGARVTTLYEEINAAIRARTGKPRLPVHISIIGPLNTRGSTDESSDEVRQAQLALPGLDRDVQVALNKLDQPLFDNFAHNSAAQHEQQARRWLQNVLAFDGLAPHGCQGPRGVKATIDEGADEIVIDVAHDGGRRLLDSLGRPDGTGLSAFDIMVNGRLLAPTAAYLDGGKVRLGYRSLEAKRGDTILWRYMYGERPDSSNVVYDDTSPQGDPRGCPMQPSRGWEPVSVD